MIKIIAGINETDFAEIKRKISLVEREVDWIQIDFLDETLFPNRTFTDLSRFQNLAKKTHFELHLMVDEPSRWLVQVPLPPFRRIISQIEAREPFEGVLLSGRRRGWEVGVSLDVSTPVEKIKPYLGDVDAALVMTVKTGFSGQPFVEEALRKVAWIKENYPDLPVEVDGGMNPETARRAVEAGATRLVSTSFIFASGDPASAIRELRKAAT
jgi:ribulose-phosphate 3-epimerase